MKQIIPVVGMALCTLLWLHARQTEAQIQPPAISIIMETTAEMPETIKAPTPAIQKIKSVANAPAPIIAITDKKSAQLCRAGFKIQ